MQCLKCKFEVNQDMKFALMKNLCPACGSNLFSKEDENDISMLRNRIMNQDFFIQLNPELAFDIALFVLNEIKNGLGQKYLQKYMKNVNINSDDEPEDSEMKKIREEVEKNYPEIEALPEGDLASEQEVSFRTRKESAEEKARRLRDIARKAGSGNKQGPIVRRLNS